MKIQVRYWVNVGFQSFPIYVHPTILYNLLILSWLNDFTDSKRVFRPNVV